MWTQLKDFATSLMVRVAVAREEGQTLVEYSLILALVSIGSILALEALNVSITGVLGTVEEALG
jgi:Flp pilus assembly pilin Flp